jgi:hypothetical protein
MSQEISLEAYWSSCTGSKEITIARGAVCEDFWDDKVDMTAPEMYYVGDNL